MNIAVFASGRGSNFQAILQAIDAGILPAQVVLLISNNSSAGAMDIARARNIPTLHISQKMFSSEEALAHAMLDALEQHRAEFIVLAGYMKKIPVPVIHGYHHRIVNIHPALLPSFGGAGMYGHHVHEAVIASGQPISGATVHLVDEEYDQGPIVLQKTVDVAPGETADSLAAKVLVIEHEIFPLALKAFAEGRVTVQGRKVWITSSY